MSRALLAVLLAATVLIGCADGDGGDSGDGGSGPEPPFTKVRVRGNCPGFMAVGLPLTVTTRITNTGSEDWPATFVATSDLDPFVINGVSLDGVEGKNVDAPSYDSWQFPGLHASESGTFRLNLTPKDAGNTDLEYSIWGDERGTRTIEGNSLYGCEDLAIQP